MLKRFAAALLFLLLTSSIGFAQSLSKSAAPPQMHTQIRSKDTHSDGICPAEPRHVSGASG